MVVSISGSIGGPAAILAKNCIKSVKVLDNEEDGTYDRMCIVMFDLQVTSTNGQLLTKGMEAVWQIDVKNFPAFIVVDDKGDDFFKEWLGSVVIGRFRVSIFIVRF
jgi:fumarate hydratase class I